MDDLRYNLDEDKVASLRRLTARLRGIRPTMPEDVVLVDRFCTAMEKDGVSVNKLVGMELERLAREWQADIPPQAAFAARLLRWARDRIVETDARPVQMLTNLLIDIEAGEIGALELVEGLSNGG